MYLIWMGSSALPWTSLEPVCWNIGCVVAKMRDHRGVSKDFMLPGSKKRVLVVMSEGNDQGATEGEDILDETLRLGKPYMNGK